MYDSEFWSMVKFVCGMLILLVLVSLLFRWGESVSCRQKWADSGYESSWGMVKGCTIKVGDRWIPADNYSVQP